jgi:hypothetical protein
MVMAAGAKRNFATMTALTGLTASLHEDRNGQEVVLVQPIHELLRYAGGRSAVRGKMDLGPVRRLRRDIGA